MQILAGSILISVGLFLFFYPNMRGCQIQREVKRFAGHLKERNEIQYAKLYQELKQYNQRLITEGQKIQDAWSYSQPPVPLENMPMEDSVIGYIEITDMEVKLPLLLGASEANLARGAAVLSETSMPIGGEDSNCVIAAHRGWKGSAYFQEIEHMKIGSEVYVTNPWETLVYRAVGMQVITPYDLDAIRIQENKDMVTLLSCHPDGVGGGQYRYLVYCERISVVEKNQEERSRTE